jgi:ATP-dependent Clp protease adaptor protein ClpS
MSTSGYELVIHNDEVHSFPYVIGVFTALGLPIERAKAKTLEIHHTGRGALPMADLPSAQAAQEKVFSFGRDPLLARSKASLVVSIERRDGTEATVVNCGRVGATGFERLDAAGVARVQREHEDGTETGGGYDLVIHNDEEHSFEYVHDLLIGELDIPRPRTERLTLDIHHRGRAVIPMKDLASAEWARDRVFRFGPDPRIPSSTTSLAASVVKRGAGGAAETLSCVRFGPEGPQPGVVFGGVRPARREICAKRACSVAATLSLILFAIVFLSVFMLLTR